MNTQTTPQTANISPQTPALFDKAILLQIDTNRFGNFRRVSSDLIEVDADRDWTSLSKRLLDSPELKAIQQHDVKTKAFLKQKCLPSVLKKGVFLLPIASIEKVTNRLEELKAQRAALVEQFLAAYPLQCQAARDRLRTLFDEDDYPDAAKVRAMFSISWSFVSFGVPEVLKTVDAALFEAEKQKQAAQWSEAQNVVQDLLRARMLGIVQHLTKKLTGKEDGKAKKFKHAPTAKIDEFLAEWEALNITNDEQLAEIVAQGKALLSGVDPEQVSGSKELQDKLQIGFAQLGEQLETMVVDKPVRAISFQDE